MVVGRQLLMDAKQNIPVSVLQTAAASAHASLVDTQTVLLCTSIWMCAEVPSLQLNVTRSTEIKVVRSTSIELPPNFQFF